jgi:hypothetical protein
MLSCYACHLRLLSQERSDRNVWFFGRELQSELLREVRLKHIMPVCSVVNLFRRLLPVGLVLFTMTRPLSSAENNTAIPARSDEANILSFGAKPGTPDYVDEAISKAIQSGVSVIYFPAGIYHVRKPINRLSAGIRQNERIIGF